SFVRDAAHSVASRVIVETVVRLGAALGIHIVAEGIETQAERALMRALGCSVGQGFLFAAPMEECKFLTLHERALVLPEAQDEAGT
ncbi:MAG: EAL domain-containing protein, partial [Hyphomicrobium sp.]